MSQNSNGAFNPGSKDARKASGGHVVTALAQDGGSTTSALHNATGAAATLVSRPRVLLPKSASSGVEALEANPANKKRAVDEASSEQAPKRTKSGSEKPIIACPYYKKDPWEHEECGRATIRSNTDMRRHLKRDHLQPLHCPTCYEQFGKGLDVEGTKRRHDHIKQKFCKPSHAGPPAGITEDQWADLQKNCEKTPGSLKRSWFQTWHILFPGEDKPSSPFFSLELAIEDAMEKYLKQALPMTPQDPATVLRRFLEYLRSRKTAPAVSPTPAKLLPNSSVAQSAPLDPVCDALRALPISDFMPVSNQYSPLTHSQLGIVSEDSNLDGGEMYISDWQPDDWQTNLLQCVQRGLFGA